MKRLREAFQKTSKNVKKQVVALPIEFRYYEPERVGERFYFRLWDKPSFVLHHKEQFSHTLVKMAEERKRTYSEKNKHYFVEFVKAESMNENDEARGLWFNELVENNIIGQCGASSTKEEIVQKRQFLLLWG